MSKLHFLPWQRTLDQFQTLFYLSCCKSSFFEGKNTEISLQKVHFVDVSGHDNLEIKNINKTIESL